MRKTLGSLLLAVCFFLVSFQSSQAQDVPVQTEVPVEQTEQQLPQDEQAPVEGQELIYSNESLTAELRRLKTQYRGELEEYRRLEDLYEIARQQYEQLGTLNSLEDGIHATQAAMEARARVLKTYLQILKVSLLQQTGVEVDQKEAAITALDETLAKVDQHHGIFEDQLDRVGLSKTSDEFKTLGVEIRQTSYRVLALLAVGELQSVYDKTSLLVGDLKSELATQGGALKQAQRQRGFDETQRKLDEILPTLQTSHGQIKNPRSAGYESVYGQLGEELETVYNQLSQALSYLQELVNL